MKIIVFGTGLYYENRKERIDTLFPTGEIVGFLDNDEEKVSHDGLPVYRPQEIIKLEYDLVLIMSSYSAEMQTQLENLNVPISKIVKWEDVEKKSSGTEIKLFCGRRVTDSKGRVLIVSVHAGYSGVPIVAAYATRALSAIGYETWLCAEEYNPKFVNEQVQNGINIIIYPNLSRGDIEEQNWLRQFDYVLINSFTMANCVMWMSAQTQVTWWLHEASDYVKKVLDTSKDMLSEIDYSKTQIMAVSDVTRTNVKKVLNEKIELLPYGIPDSFDDRKADNEKVKFGIIGTIEKRKAQDIFIDAASRLDGDTCEFILIGAVRDKEFAETQFKKIAGSSYIKYNGELTQKGVNDFLSELDVLVCPSREDPFPVTVIEAMMHGIPVIVSDKTGEAAFITNGENGYVFESDNVNELLEYIELLANNKELRTRIGQNARKLYESNFTMEHFAQRLQAIIEQTK